MIIITSLPIRVSTQSRKMDNRIVVIAERLIFWLLLFVLDLVPAKATARTTKTNLNCCDTGNDNAVASKINREHANDHKGIYPPDYVC
jgi:hypothetical protein